MTALWGRLPIFYTKLGRTIPEYATVAVSGLQHCKTELDKMDKNYIMILQGILGNINVAI